MVSFGIILDHFVPKAAQMVQMLSFGHHFGPNAAQMLQMTSLGTILDHFGPKAAQMFQLNNFGSILNPFKRHPPRGLIWENEVSKRFKPL